MCGIVGIIDLKGRAVDPSWVERMCDAVRHRGPDEAGYYVKQSVALGHRRLRIIDLSTGGQPLSNEDGSIWISFNGEIYNFQSLRAELTKLGHKFGTQSDTETIVHAYEQYGAQCLQRLRGMFAFAIWDEKQSSLLLARDRVGKKPCYYMQVDGRFLFASELQSLLRCPRVPRDVDPTAIDDYLTYGYVPAPKTIFRGIRKLPPAHYLTLTLRPHHVHAPKIESHRYWRLQYKPKWNINEHEAIEGLREVLTEAVRLRLISEVPLGALLSGGVDSSVVVALMSRLSDRPVKTFSIGFGESGFDESSYARQVACRYGTEHHELYVRPRATEVLPTLVRHYGEPNADSSAVPSYYLAKLARQHVTVALNGDGGDENLAGYERYLGSLVGNWYRRIPAQIRRGLVEPVFRLVPGSLPRRHHLSRGKRFVEAASQPAPNAYLNWVSYCRPALRRALYRPEFQRELNGYNSGAWLLELFEQVSPNMNEPLDAALATDVESYLAHDLLVKMDIATMANSLEARSPFLDHKVMEYCARLPTCFKHRRGKLKYLLKKLASALLPAENVNRRKMGFGVPVGNWIRGELHAWVQGQLLSKDACIHTYLAPETIRQLWREHCADGKEHGHQLWALLWLECWHREVCES